MNKKGFVGNIVGTFVIIFVGVTLINSLTNKRGLLGNIIGTFVVIIVGITLASTVANQITNLTFCNQTNQTNGTNIISEADTGATNSFGGGGTEHFGGYDGKVVHANWLGKVGGISPVKSNQSIIGCLPLDPNSTSASVLGLLPAFFIVSLLLISFMVLRNSLFDSGTL